MIDYLIGECCTQGFPTLSAINSLAASCSQSNRCLRDSGRGDSGSTYIMPNMRFTCDGTIVRWSAGDIHDPEPYIYMNLVYMVYMNLDSELKNLTLYVFSAVLSSV